MELLVFSLRSSSVARAELLAKAAILAVVVLCLSILPTGTAQAFKQLGPFPEYCGTVSSVREFALVAESSVSAEDQKAAQAALGAWNRWSDATTVHWSWSPAGAPAGAIPVFLRAGQLGRGVNAESVPSCANGVLSQAVIRVGATFDAKTSLAKERVLVHEMGHILGLKHSEYEWPCTTIMQAEYNWNYWFCGDDYPAPYADDVAGVAARFAPNATAGLPAKSILTNPDGLSISSPSAYVAGVRSTAFFSTSTGDDEYTWTFVPAPSGRGWGFLVNTDSGLCLKDSEPVLGITQSLGVDSCRYEGSYWTVRKVQGDKQGGTVQLLSALTKKCVGASSLTEVSTTFDCTDARTFLKATAAPAAGTSSGRSKRALADTGHNLIGQGSGKCLSVTGASRTPGAGLSLASCASNAEQLFEYQLGAQLLTVYQQPADSIPDGAVVDDPALCVTAAPQAENRAAVTAEECAQNALNKYQQWALDQNGNVRNAATGLCLTVEDASTRDGARVFQYSCATGGNAVWNMPSLIGKASVTLVSLASPTGRGIAATPAPASAAKKATQTSLAASGDANDTWTWESLGGPTGDGLLRNIRTGECLRWSANNSGAVTDAGCNVADQRYWWTPSPQDNGSFTFEEQYGGQCLDLWGAADAAGTTVGTYTCSGAVNQKWRVVPVVQKLVTAGTPPAATASVALFGTATQSSTGYSGTAGRAIDGNTNGNYDAGSTTHTNLEAHPWWDLDLGQPTTIKNITVYNRTDCCTDRSSDIWIFTSSTPFPRDWAPSQITTGILGVSSHHVINSTPQSTISWDIEDDVRYVRVQLSGTNFLSIGEVTVTAK